MTSPRFCAACGGALERKRMEGRERAVCPRCGRISYENPVPATAAVVMNGEGSVLLVRRRVPPHPGRWCLPGGFLEVDETPEAGCLRELREETGLIGRVDSLIHVEPGASSLYRCVLVIGFRVDGVRGRLRAGDDAEAVRYFSFAEVPELAFRSHQRILESSRPMSRAASARPIRPRLPRGAYVITSGEHAAVAAAACRGGARVIQFRDKRLSRGRMLEVARELRRITRKAGALLVVNDAPDVALLSRADGVHLGQDDLPLEAVRPILPPEMIVGVSTHSLEQALAAQAAGADYIGIGPAFSTPTKADYEPIGLDTVRRVAGTVTLPVVAIGGINGDNLKDVAATGVANVAMVRAFAADPEGMVRRVNRLLSPAETDDQCSPPSSAAGGV